MARREINKTLQKQLYTTFVQLLLDLKNKTEIELFLRDFLTPAELNQLTKRLAILYWLRKGRSYENIQTNLKASPAEIAKLKKLLATRGVALALKKVEAEEWANVWEKKIKKLVR